jgi:hypothetical protein
MIGFNKPAKPDIFMKPSGFQYLSHLAVNRYGCEIGVALAEYSLRRRSTICHSKDSVEIKSLNRARNPLFSWRRFFGTDGSRNPLSLCSQAWFCLYLIYLYFSFPFQIWKLLLSTEARIGEKKSDSEASARRRVAEPVEG